MTDQEARYDRNAEGYAAWWAPVHMGATLHLLDEIDPHVRGDRPRILDVGCGTGVLAADAVRRWPGVTVDAIDASEGMLRVAERQRATLPGEARNRLRLGRAFADRLPFAEATFDVVVTAFVLQLVPSRFRALREARRVLRPGGRLACVAWLQGGEPFAADTAFDEALAAVGLEPRQPDGGHDDPASPAEAAAQVRRAGYAETRAQAGELVHRFTPEGFLEFLARFDEEDLFTSLDTDLRRRLELEVLARLRALPPDGLRLVLPVAYVSGRRPRDRG